MTRQTIAPIRERTPQHECIHRQGQNAGWATAVPSPTLNVIYLRRQHRLVEGCPY